MSTQPPPPPTAAPSLYILRLRRVSNPPMAGGKLRRRKSVWRAEAMDNSSLWEDGMTKEEAVGRWVLAHGGYAGVKVEG